jgi:hypothetical protein
MIFRRKIMLFYAQDGKAARRAFFPGCSIAPLQQILSERWAADRNADFWSQALFLKRCELGGHMLDFAGNR